MMQRLARIRAPRGWYVLTTLDGTLVWAWSPDCEDDMSTKLESVNGHIIYIRNDGALRALFRGDVASLVAAIDAGHLDALRHYAEHGTLPPEPPVWPGLSVRPRTDGWQVWNEPLHYGESGLLIASVVRQAGDTRWHCSVHHGPCVMHYGDTPQQAVDAARTWLADRWGLSA